jgi:hypothetical protein
LVPSSGLAKAIYSRWLRTEFEAEVRLVAASRPVNAPYGPLVDSFQRR